MQFQMGKVLIKVSLLQEVVMVVFPVSDHVVSLRGELFRLGGNNSITAGVDVYQKNDVVSSAKVSRELGELE